MLSRFFASRNLSLDDGAVYLPQFLDKPTDYLSWTDVESCLNRDDVFWELIGDNGTKTNVEMFKPFWSPVPCQDKNTIYEHVQSNRSFVITGYSKVNKNVRRLCIEVERSTDSNVGVHVYGSRGKSPSFPIHCDNFANFIIQTIGQTKWRVYKNKHSSLLRPTIDKNIKHGILDIEWEGVLSPGDMLYIPNRAYHQAIPNGTRLSMSIPCAPSVLTDAFYDRRYYQIQANN